MLSTIALLAATWRALALPLAALLALTCVAVNAYRPGAVVARLQRGWRWVLMGVAAIALLPVAAVTVPVLSGNDTPRDALFALALLGAQVLLYQRLPEVLLCAALVLVVLLFDRRRASFGHWAYWSVRGIGVGHQERWMAATTAAGAGLAAALAASLLWPDAMQGWLRADPPDAQRFNYYASYVYRGVPNDPEIEEFRGFEAGYYGLTLPPGGEGTVVYRLTREPSTVVHLRPNFFNRLTAEDGKGLGSVSFPNRLELAAGEGAAYRTLFADQSIGEVTGNQVLDLTPQLGDARTYRLRFTSRNTTATTATVLSLITISTVADPLASPHPSFPIVVYAAATAALSFLALRAVAARQEWTILGAVAAGLLPAVIGRAAGAAILPSPIGEGPGVRSDPLAHLLFDPAGSAEVITGVFIARTGFALAILAAAAVCWRSMRSRSTLQTTGAWLAAACIVVGALGLDARWNALMPVRFDRLVPDALGYQTFADSYTRKLANYRPASAGTDQGKLREAGYDGRANPLVVFYAGGNNGREPGWPATLRLVFNALGSSGFHTRLTSLLLSVAVAAGSCLLGWRLLHPLAGLAGGLLLALHAPAAANSVLGLREELVSALLLCAVAALFVGLRRRQTPGWTRLAVAGVTCAGVALVRGDMIVLTLELIGAAALVLRWHWRRALVPAALVATLVAPMYAGYAVTYGDPFYPGTYGATVNRNLEFQDRLGTPGFPTREQYALNWASPPYISASTYFFGYHTPVQFVTYAARGFLRIFPEFLYRDQPLRLVVFLAGAGLLLAQRRWLLPFAIVVGLVPFYSFLAGAPGPMFVPRYAYHVLPFTELAAGFALVTGLLWASRLMAGRLPIHVAPPRNATVAGSTHAAALSPPS